MRTKDTKARALEFARDYLQKHGFHGFSFGHLAKALGIKAPSLYDHFDSKEDLGNRLIDGYREQLDRWWLRVKDQSPEVQIRGMFENFCRFARDQQKFCPSVALAGDWQTLPHSMRENLRGLIGAQRLWLEGLVAMGMREGTFASGDAKVKAQVVMSMALGAQILARLGSDSQVILQSAEEAIRLLKEKRST